MFSLRNTGIPIVTNVDDKTWLNYPDAERFETTLFGDSKNCILIL